MGQRSGATNSCGVGPQPAAEVIECSWGFTTAEMLTLRRPSNPTLHGFARSPLHYAYPAGTRRRTARGAAAYIKVEKRHCRSRI